MTQQSIALVGLSSFCRTFTLKFVTHHGIIVHYCFVVTRLIFPLSKIMTEVQNNSAQSFQKHCNATQDAREDAPASISTGLFAPCQYRLCYDREFFNHKGRCIWSCIFIIHMLKIVLINWFKICLPFRQTMFLSWTGLPEIVWNEMAKYIIRMRTETTPNAKLIRLDYSIILWKTPGTIMFPFLVSVMETFVTIWYYIRFNWLLLTHWTCCSLRR